MSDFGQSKIGTAQIEWPAELAIGGRCAPLHLFQVEAEAPAQRSERLAGQVLIHQHARGDIEPTRRSNYKNGPPLFAVLDAIHERMERFRSLAIRLPGWKSAARRRCL